MVPHVVNELIDWIARVAEKPVDRLGWRSPEICLLEIGGTVGDIESEIFIETVRQMKLRLGNENICLVHLSYVPVVGSNNEQKSKPTQHSAKVCYYALNAQLNVNIGTFGAWPASRHDFRPLHFGAHSRNQEENCLFYTGTTRKCE